MNAQTVSTACPKTAKKTMPDAAVIGAGLAGCEAAIAMANRGVLVTLYEMKPLRKSPAHHLDTLAELVCSNSLKAMREDSASGILKREMRQLGSAVMQCADVTSVAAGGALAVDRVAFSKEMTGLIEGHPNIRLAHEEICSIPRSGPVIVSTGPLTDGALARDIGRLTGEPLSFYDAASPIVSVVSVDMEHAFFGGRYDQPKDYINCPLSRDEYERFYSELIHARRAVLHDFDVRHFEGCMPIEVLANRGFQTPLFGPMSPKGIVDPKTGRRPFALVQLRREDAAGSMWNLVGFQTNLAFAEQKRVFSLIPALKDADYVRYGAMHRNTYLPSGALDGTLSLKNHHRIKFAGQITGVEGYLESACMGHLAGLFMAYELHGMQLPAFNEKTAVGALLHYVSGYEGADYQPMSINFAIMAPLEGRIKDKAQRHRQLSERADAEFRAALAACRL